MIALREAECCALAGTDCRPTPLRRRASRPQLKRDPLGDSTLIVSMLKTCSAVVAVFSLLSACRKETTDAARPSLSRASPACPTEPPLEPGLDAKDKAIEAVRRSLEAGNQAERHYRIERAYPATEGGGFAPVALHMCGPTVGKRTWVVEVRFPRLEPSASLSQGQAFVSRFRSGWKVWYRYH